jgi:shikimate dehydrogenase
MDRYAVIGNPIGHSKSPLIHAGFAEATGQALSYAAIEAPLDGFADAVRAFMAAGGRGMNITAPFKLQAFALADRASERARRAGAANAFRFEAGGSIAADNFDGIGLVNDIQRNRGLPLAGKRILLLGAGGAARGVLQPLLQAGPARLTIANRSADKAEALARAFAADGPVDSAGFAALAGARFDLVINATSAPADGGPPPLDPRAFAPDALAYELAYGRGLTPFLRLARDADVRQLADGVGMLVEQAAEAFAWWRGVRPQTAAAIDRLTVPLV